MSFDSMGRYTPNHKSWDHVGNMIPVVEHSEGVRPHGEFKPAAWLPVQFFDKYQEVYFVVLPGKVLAFDNDGRVVPAGIALGTNISYTANDVAAGTIDVETGLPVAAPVDRVVAELEAADGTFLGRADTPLSVSKPVGVAPYAYYQWAGDSSALDDGFNPSAYRQHNHNLQHRVAILCDYVLELPLVPAAETTAETLTDKVGGHSGSVTTLAAVAKLPVAKNTQRTKITFSESLSTAFVNEVASAAEIAAAGDWAIDLASGVISVFSASALGATGGNLKVTYSHYKTAVTGASVFAAASGNLKAGDFVKCDESSNFVLANPDPSDVADFDGADSLLTRANVGDTFADIVGQVIEVESAEKDALGMVKTAYNPPLGTDASGSSPGYAGQMDQMPGSATGGVSDKVHYAGAADLVVRINLVSR